MRTGSKEHGPQQACNRMRSKGGKLGGEASASRSKAERSASAKKAAANKGAKKRA